jgi:hypothetical protein
VPESPEHHPTLLKASTIDESDIGSCAWDRTHNSDYLEVSHNGKTVAWTKTKGNKDWPLPPAWIPARTLLHLHSGTYRWNFTVEQMGRAQLGIGFLLFWELGPQRLPDWGFFGYLGASPTAWSYDPSSGDVVTDTKSIEGGLPKFQDGETGVVSVELDLPRSAAGSAHFISGGVRSRAIPMPEGAVLLPAACFLKQGQRVTLADFERGLGNQTGQRSGDAKRGLLGF